MAITLNSGYKMPTIGLGVWRMDKTDVRDLIINSIKLGYRHFDCTADYKNEAEVGEALAEAFKTGLMKREDLFITTKLWNSDHGHVEGACKDSLKKLQLDYLDLYLVHFPVATRHTGKSTYVNGCRIEKRDSPDSRSVEGDLKDSKRQKKLNYDPLETCVKSDAHVPLSTPTQTFEVSCPELNPKSEVPPSVAQLPSLSEDSSVKKTTCAFCQTSKISEASGPMMHYVNLMEIQ